MPKYIIILAMLYLVAFIFPIMLAYRMVQLGPLLEAGGTIIFPASYLVADMIAEVYGYKIARQLLWSAIFCQLLISVCILAVLHLPTPSGWHNEGAFDIVLGNALRYALASTIGNFAGEFINIYFITKFKILMKGRYFWLRSLASTCIGEFVLTLIVFSITFIGVMTSQQVIWLTISAYIFKVLFALVASFPASLLVRLVKKSEGIDVYDYNTDFNPFKFAIRPESSKL